MRHPVQGQSVIQIKTSAIDFGIDIKKEHYFKDFN